MLGLELGLRLGLSVGLRVGLGFRLFLHNLWKWIMEMLLEALGMQENG